jgi:hypothetical protein
MASCTLLSAVIPAKAGIQFQAAAMEQEENWIPAFAGMTPCLFEDVRVIVDVAMPCPAGRI